MAGKTGTAEAPPLKWPVVDENGKKLGDEKGREKRREVKPNTPGNPRPEAPWYRVSAKGERTHAWFIGFAPADNPQIAFAVMMEYGGSGGTDAAPVVKALLEGCMKHGYLSLPGRG